MSIQIKQVMKGPNEIVPFNHPFIQYPQYASQKYDGFRCLNLCGERLLSPALKDIPNDYLRDHLRHLIDYCFEERVVTDGEIWSPDLAFNDLQSIIRSKRTPIPAHVSYYIFDAMTEDKWNNGTEETFDCRFCDYFSKLSGFDHVVRVEQQRVLTAAEAEALFEQHIALGHEGIILRALDAKYKHGRCTTKQDGMWKFKEFQTLDGVIVGVEEQMRLKEGVARTTNEIGHLERRYEQGLYEPAGMVGAFEIEHEGQRFKVKPGKGMDNTRKRCAWADYIHKAITSPLGKHIEYKFMPHGAKDKPRIGSLVRFRPDLDV